MPRIFISYRRADSQTIAGRIDDRLATSFGLEDIFKDVDTIQPGSDFVTVLRDAVHDCDVMLVLIGPQWTSISGADGRPRLEKPDDYVRQEVEMALDHPDVAVIPVLVSGATMPSLAELPSDTLKLLTRRNAVQVRDDPDFHRDMDRLILHIEPEASRRWVVGVAALAVVALVVLLLTLSGLGDGEQTPAAPLATESTNTAVADALTAAAALFTETPEPTETQTRPPSDTLTKTLTVTFTPTDTPSNTLTLSDTPTYTATATDMPSDTPTATRTSSPTHTPEPTATPTLRPSDTPTRTPTLSATDYERMVQAEIGLVLTQQQQDQAADATASLAAATTIAQNTAGAQTATATMWTATPTPDTRATAFSRLTETQEAVIAQVTQDAVATETQAALNLTVMATLWTDTPTPTNMFTPTPTSTSTPKDTPTATFTPLDTLTATLTPREAALQRVLNFSGGNDNWEPYSEVVGSVEYVLVPAGCFIMGSTDFTDEQPVHEVCFDEPFWIDQYEVTNEQYTSCVEAEGCDPPVEDYRPEFKGEQQPVVGVTWWQARDYCEWREARLPTEAEWEYAARGADSWKYPWGDTFSGVSVLWANNNEGYPAVVGSRPGGISWVGAYDMSGNVWEWVSTIYDQERFPYPYPYATADGREEADATSRRVLRGGSWKDDYSDSLRAANRNWNNPVIGNSSYGFRCASAAAPIIPGSTNASSVVESKTITLPGASEWLDSGVVVSNGQTFRIVATGSVNPCPEIPECVYHGPAGLEGGESPAQMELDHWQDYPMPNNVTIALIGRIGEGNPFVVGTGGTFTADADGTLQFTMNDWFPENNLGNFTVEIELLN